MELQIASGLYGSNEYLKGPEVSQQDPQKAKHAGTPLIPFP